MPTLVLSVRELLPGKIKFLSLNGSNIPFRWRQNGHDGVSNHQPHDFLLNRGFGRRLKKICASLAFVLYEEWPVNYPHKWPVTLKMFPFDDVIMPQWVKDYWSVTGNDGWISIMPGNNISGNEPIMTWLFDLAVVEFLLDLDQSES